MDNEFDSQSELCREQVQRASPQYTFPDSGKKDDAVCHVCLKFQGYRAAIDKRILGEQPRTVIQYPLAPVHGLIAGQCGTADREEDRLCRIRQEFQIIAAFCRELRTGYARIPIPLILHQILGAYDPAVGFWGVSGNGKSGIIIQGGL